jgi:hypothetical protein
MAREEVPKHNEVFTRVIVIAASECGIKVLHDHVTDPSLPTGLMQQVLRQCRGHDLRRVFVLCDGRDLGLIQAAVGVRTRRP